MSDTQRHRTRYLAVAPRSRAFGFAVFEDPDRLVDWGTRTTRHRKTASTIRNLCALLEAYRPDAVVIEDAEGDGSRRAPRIRRLLRRIRQVTARHGREVVAVSVPQVRRVFRATYAFNKHEIARELVRRFPELAPRLPPPRELWMSEDERMSIFDAVALIITHLQSTK